MCGAVWKLRCSLLGGTPDDSNLSRLAQLFHSRLRVWGRNTQPDAYRPLSNKWPCMNKEAHIDTRRSLVDTPRGALVVLVCLLVSSIVLQTASAQGRERSGEEVVKAVCAACHTQGVNGAPKVGDPKAWKKLESHGLTSLTDVALRGIRKMPPHGGNPKLTDIEIARAITYMVNESGGNWIEPINKSSPPTERNGKQVVQAHCAKCHQNGVGGAPKIGERAAWIPRLRQGFEVVVRSAIKGHGSMPSRGGVADATDSELRAAIIYMINGK